MSTPGDLSQQLTMLNLGAWRYFPVVGSTNDVALSWAKSGAPEWSLIVADAQTAGRGRGSRTWVTNPGAALALSVILHPKSHERKVIPRFTTLAALGCIHALEELGITGEIKWPNDILLNGKKVGGVLVEINWTGELPTSLVIGLGVNITHSAVPLPATLRYPATSVEDVLGRIVDRWAFLAAILHAMMILRGSLGEDDFIAEWNQHLAFTGEIIQFCPCSGDAQPMRVMGIIGDGALALENAEGQRIEATSGEIVWRE